jgi:SAM-dependent methyltransferase
MKGKDIVQAFYNTTPFPDYELERFEEKEDLRLAAETFSRVLDRSIPANASIIDAGTGTGELSAFLSLRRKDLWGIDFSDSSLAKARALKEKLGLDSLTLMKIDLLDEAQISSIGRQFDYLLCLGVLHHTSDPYKGFQNIIKLAKPGGYVAIGLYNRYGRLLLKIRRLLAKTIFRNSERVKNYFIRLQIGEVEDKEKIRGWWNDQYLHPRESSHTIGKVLSWFKKNGIEYIEAAPSLMPWSGFDIEASGVWNGANEKYPNLLVRFYKQLKWIWTTHRDGGYFVMFGRKKDD